MCMCVFQFLALSIVKELIQNRVLRLKIAISQGNICCDEGNLDP